MEDLDYRQIRDLLTILDYYVRIVNSMFEEIRQTEIDERVESLVVFDKVPMEELNKESLFPLECVHMFGIQFLSYIFNKLEIPFLDIRGKRGELALSGRFPIKDYYILWKKLPLIEWQHEFDSNNIVFRCFCQVGVIRKVDYDQASQSK